MAGRIAGDALVLQLQQSRAVAPEPGRLPAVGVTTPARHHFQRKCRPFVTPPYQLSQAIGGGRKFEAGSREAQKSHHCGVELCGSKTFSKGTS
jgi:hypothetical protein